MQGRVALVTGASRGIGRAIALALARAGADVAVNYRAQSEEAASARSEIEAQGRRSIAIQADVSDAASVRELVKACQAGLGPIDILVNNAGIARAQQIPEISEQDWDEILDTNLKSCFLLTQAVLPGMRERQWGRIINIGSVAAQVGGVVGPHYAASKAGMQGLTHFYASRLAKEGVTVNCIAPALIETDMVLSNLNARPEIIPVGRFGTAEEVAATALMLVQNAYVTGQTIHVNGGWYMT